MTRKTIIQIVAILLVGAATAYGVLSVKRDHAPDGQGAHEDEGESHNDAHDDDLRTEIAESVMADMGIRILSAGSCKIAPSMRISGLVVSDPQRTAHLSARYDGMVRRVNTHIGDRVHKGEILAQIEGNESLTTYNVSSSLSGVVTDMHIALSESVGPDQILFTVADLSRVWVELAVPVSRAKAMKPGAGIEIHLPDGTSLPAKIAHVAPTVNMASQSVEAHAEIDNREGVLRPGTFVDIDLTTSSKSASLCVEQIAIQSLGDSTVVFVRHGNSIEARPVELGLRDAKQVEILGGLAPQESYVADGSFLIKADILKSGASHEH